MHESLTMEQFNSPLVSPQYKSTYAIVATSESPKELKDVNVSEESVRLDTRPESTVGPPSCSSSPTNSPARHSQHYRTLQSYTSPTAKLNIAATSNHQRDVDQIHSKRWHTAPKEKHKIPAPVVSWNIAPSMNKPYKCKEIEPTNIPRQCLRTTEKLGSRNIGEAIVCEAVGLEDAVADAPRLVVARVPACAGDIRGRKYGGPDKRGPISVQPVRPERGADPGSVRRGTSPVDDHRVHGTR
uniref:Discoidin domain receptor n=1 Tax=Apis cerana TaxID=7461 RepID=V9ICQ0_APICE